MITSDTLAVFDVIMLVILSQRRWVRSVPSGPAGATAGTANRWDESR